LEKAGIFDMKKNAGESIARALFDYGVKVVTSVPASGANEVFDQFNLISGQHNPVSFNEEPAYSIVHGAALTGTRAAALVKSHGIIKAGNSVSDSLFAGTVAGMLAVIFTDKSGLHSDSILEIEPFLEGIGLPYEVADSANMYGQVIELLQRSEKLALPHALVVDTEEIQKTVQVPDRVASAGTLPRYRRNIAQHVLCPFFAEYQRDVLKYKTGGRDWTKIPLPVNPHLPESIPPKWKPLVQMYAGLFSVFQKIRGPIVFGETGISSLFACEPYKCIDIVTYMGGSVPLAVGACMAGNREAWAVAGDFTFVSAGHMALLEAMQRGLPLKLLILYNGQAATTGGQIISPNILETLLQGYYEYVSYIKDPDNLTEVETALKKAKMSDKLAVVIADYRGK